MMQSMAVVRQESENSDEKDRLVAEMVKICEGNQAALERLKDGEGIAGLDRSVGDKVIKSALEWLNVAE